MYTDINILRGGAEWLCFSRKTILDFNTILMISFPTGRRTNDVADNQTPIWCSFP